MKIEEKTDNGLYYRSWKCNTPKAAVLLIHGLGEHCQRYEHLAAALNEQGYSLYSMDLPGHGRSEGDRGHVDSFKTYIDVTLTLLNKVNVDLPTLPKFILGHSMGGLIVSHFLLEHQHKVDGALLSGPAIESAQEPAVFQVLIIKAIATFFPKNKMLALDASQVSRDPAVVEKYMNDPLISKEKLSARFLIEMNRAMTSLKNSLQKISLPLFIMHGSKDTMTSPKGSSLLFTRCASTDKKLELYEGLYHEILNEPEQALVISDIISWLNTQLTAPKQSGSD